MGTLRAAFLLAGFFALTVPLMPVQALLLSVYPSGARRFPHWYHRQVCRLLGVTLSIEGKLAPCQPVLLVSNHTSWLDIPVLSAFAPVSFIAKKEVESWPFVSALARLQHTIFVDRTRRQTAGDATNEITARLAAGDTVVLFAEGTSSDGNQVLPFKTSLFGAVMPDTRTNATVLAAVQTCAIVYTHRNGISLGRADRPDISWYGDMEMQSHAWALLKSGPLRVTIRIGPPVPLQSFTDRKALALSTEREVRLAVLEILRGNRDGEPLQPVEPGAESRKLAASPRAPAREKWT